MAKNKIINVQGTAIVVISEEYESSHKRSLSGLIEAYLKTLIVKDKTQTDNDIEISPFVKSLRTGVKIPADYDNKEVYINYLAEKYRL